jgi:hypothetical protein
MNSFLIILIQFDEDFFYQKKYEYRIGEKKNES